MLLTNEMQPKTVACDFRACEMKFFFNLIISAIFFKKSKKVPETQIKENRTLPAQIICSIYIATWLPFGVMRWATFEHFAQCARALYCERLSVDVGK